MVEIGKLVGRKTVALLSDMNQPLGKAVGNSLELLEALDTLNGNGPKDFREHCMVSSGYMLALGGLARDETQGKKMAEEALDSGKALLRFRDLVRAQGGDVRYVDEPSRFPNAKWIRGVRSPQSGYLTEINARDAGETSVLLGGGRAQKGDPIDYTVGLVLERKVGDPVKAGDLLFTVHANDEEKMEEAIHNMLNAHQWSDEPVKPLPLYYGMIS